MGCRKQVREACRTRVRAVERILNRSSGKRGETAIVHADYGAVRVAGIVAVVVSDTADIKAPYVEIADVAGERRLAPCRRGRTEAVRQGRVVRSSRQ